jgi:hypothetical protein
VAIDLPFQFIVLDTLSTIKGFNKADKASFWSNEVKDLRTDVLTVRLKRNVVASGLYQEIKDSIKSRGAKFCQSVYACVREGEELKIVNLQFTGAALSSWIEFCNKNKVYGAAIKVDQSMKGENGGITYQIPVFRIIPINPNTLETAIELDKQVQEHLKIYFNRSKDEVATIHAAEVADGKHEPEDDYEQRDDPNDALALTTEPVSDLPF